VATDGTGPKRRQTTTKRGRIFVSVRRRIFRKTRKPTNEGSPSDEQRLRQTSDDHEVVRNGLPSLFLLASMSRRCLIGKCHRWLSRGSPRLDDSLTRSNSSTWCHRVNHASAASCFPSFSTLGGGDCTDPKTEWIIHSDLNPHIRANLSSLEDDGSGSTPTISKEHSRDTGFSLCFLGTGAGKPSIRQSNSAAALRMGGTIYLFDAGEGIQLQLMRSRLKMGDIRKIFSEFRPGDYVCSCAYSVCVLMRIFRIISSVHEQ